MDDIRVKTKRVWTIDGVEITDEEMARLLRAEVRKGNTVRILSLSFDVPWWHFWEWPWRFRTRLRLWWYVRKLNRQAKEARQQ